MRRTHTEQKTTAENVNLTPLIDVVFILLIFFLVTASLTKESGIEVDRPTAKSAVREEQSSIIIGINSNGDIWIDDQQIEIRKVRPFIEHLYAQNPEGKVIILADKNATTGMTVEVLDQVRLAGVSHVSIAAKKE